MLQRASNHPTKDDIQLPIKNHDKQKIIIIVTVTNVFQQPHGTKIPAVCYMNVKGEHKEGTSMASLTQKHITLPLK